MEISRFFRWHLRRINCFFRRVTPLTWLIWAVTISDLCAPGYLQFHLVITTVDASGIAAEGLAVWEVITRAAAD